MVYEKPNRILHDFHEIYQKGLQIIYNILNDSHKSTLDGLGL